MRALNTLLILVALCADLWAQELRPMYIAKAVAIDFCDFSSDGNYVVTAGPEGGKIWGIKSGKLLNSFTGSASGFSKIKLSSDNKYLISTGLEENKIRIWNTSNGELLTVIPVMDDLRVSDIQVTPDSKYCVISYNVYDFGGAKRKSTPLDFIDLGGLKKVKTIKLDGKTTAIRLTAGGNSVIVAFSNERNTTINTYSLPAGILQKKTTQKRPSIDSRISAIYPSSENDLLTIYDYPTNQIDRVDLLTGKVINSKEYLNGAIMMSNNLTAAIVSDTDSISVITYPMGIKIISFPSGRTKVFVNADGKKIAVINDEEFSIYTVGENAKATFKVFSVPIRGGFKSPFNSFFSDPISAVFMNRNSILIGDSENALLVRDTTNLPPPQDSTSFYTNQSIRSVSRDSLSFFMRQHEEYFTQIDQDNTEGGMLRTFYYTLPKAPKVKYKLVIGDIFPGGNTIDVSADNDFVLTTAFTMRPAFVIWKSNGQQQLKWEMTDELNWIVTDPSGHFDCSNKALEEIYFVDGLQIANREMSLKKLYQPGLMNRILLKK